MYQPFGFERGALLQRFSYIEFLVFFLDTRQHAVAKLLIEYGADVNLRATNGCGAFEVATFNGDTEMMQLIASIAMGRKSKPGVFSSINV